MLKDKIVVVTGGSRGLGKSLAKFFKKEQAQVIIIGRNKKELKKTGEELNVKGLVCDITKELLIKKTVDKIVKEFGEIDIWVNNAGVWVENKSIEEQKTKEIQMMLNVNVFGLLYSSRNVMKYMQKQRQKGCIINIISSSGLIGRPMSSGYSLSKWAARGFSESLRLALEPFSIPVYAIYMQGMKTEIFKNHKPQGYDNFMEPDYVAQKIVSNLKIKNPKLDLIIEK